jgi:uracil-DNA glycosylase
MLPKIIHESWNQILEDIFEEEGESIRKTLPELRPYYPSPDRIFAAFQIPFPPRLVIVGQDPYPRKGLATGIAFGVPAKEWSPSLEIIYNEVALNNNDIFYKGDPTMMSWVNQGVLMLNATLTVKPGEPANKRHIALWEPFMQKVVKAISTQVDIPWMLWGDRAKKLKSHIEKGFVLESVHPIYDFYSMERRFHGCNHFRKVNEHLSSISQPLIKF